jgi:hypothetical protein
MKPILFFFILIFFHSACNSQTVDFSIPQRLNSNNTRLDILGKYSEGILVLEHSHNNDFLETFYDDMTLHWRKPMVLKDKDVEVQKILIAGDSVTVVYLQFVKSITLLKISRLNDMMVETSHSIILDTLSTNTTSPLPIIRFTSSEDHKLFLIFTTADNFYESKQVQFYLFDSQLKLIMKKSQAVARDLTEPTLIDATVDAQSNIVCLLGERAAHSQRDGYNIEKLMVSILKNGLNLTELTLSEPKEFYTHPAMGFDVNHHRLILTGFYGTAPGETGEGTFYYNVNIDSQTISRRGLDKFSDDFISMVTGNIPPKNNDSFDNFQVIDVVVKKGGGAILMAESQFQTSESMANPMYGPFGVASSVIINYYHYDDIAIFSFDSSGNMEWEKVLHKRQETEGDAGYYSSYSMLISNQLDFVYNDNSSGQSNVASYSVKPDGEILRADLFNGDQKGIQLIPKFGKQVSAHELVIPSVKRGNVQFVKFTF